MPKERTDGCLLPYGEEGEGRSIVEVSWGRETGHVQIVSKCVNRFTGDRFVPEPTPEEIKAGASPIHYTDGMYVDLDRRGINNLIRNLRRARDQAFGRDE